MILLAVHSCRCGKPCIRKKSKSIADSDFIVVGQESKTVIENTVYTARGTAKVVSKGARGVAMDQACVTGLLGAETVALDKSHVVGEEFSRTIIFPGASARIKHNARAVIESGVKAYVRNGGTVVNEGGRIYNTGDPTVLPGLEPAGVVGESGAVIHAKPGSAVIVEPNVLKIFKTGDYTFSGPPLPT
jgi:hypothetical protein